MNAVPDDFEFIDSEFVIVKALSLLPNVGDDPVCLDGFFALSIDVLTAQFEACAHIVVTIDGQLGQF